jgi:hypothetical protein
VSKPRTDGNDVRRAGWSATPPRAYALRAMWSDTLLLAERAALLRLAMWAAASVVAGTAVFALLVVRRMRSPLLDGFALQMVIWGTIGVARVVVGMGALVPRDLSAATRLDRWVWLLTGLDVGLVAVGATLAITGWLLGRRLGVIGAGIGIIVQGAALFALDARFATILSGLV